MALTLIAATAASTDTGWTQLYSTEWTDPTLTLTLTGTGRVSVDIRGKRIGGEVPLFAGEVSWSASGSQAITLPTFSGKVRLSIRILTTSGTIAATLSDPTGTPSIDASGKTIFQRRIMAPGQLVPMAGQTVRVVIRGDSIQANAVTGGSMQLAAILSGGEYMIAWNDAVPSSTLTQFDARFNSIPSWVQYDQDWIQGGTNAPGITTANKDAIASLAAKSISRGAEPIFFAIPPTNGVPTSAHDWNSWLWCWCVKNSFRFVNPWADIIDPATGNMAAGYTIEGTHPNYPAHVLAAKRILEALRPNGSVATGFRSIPFLPNVNAPTNSGIINNALHLTDTGADGLADGWTAGATGGTTVTPTLASESLPYIGKAQRFQCTTTNPWRIQSRALTTVAGRRYRLIEHFKLDTVASDAARNGRLEVRIYDHTGAMLCDHGQWADASVAVEGILIRDFVPPGASVTISYKLFCGSAGNASADFSIGNQQCYDLTALGLDP